MSSFKDENKGINAISLDRISKRSSKVSKSALIDINEIAQKASLDDMRNIIHALQRGLDQAADADEPRVSNEELMTVSKHLQEAKNALDPILDKLY